MIDTEITKMRAAVGSSYQESSIQRAASANGPSFSFFIGATNGI